MFAQATLENCFFELPRAAHHKKFAAVVDYQHIGTAIDGDPSDPIARANIFIVDGYEYLVPEDCHYENGKLVESTTRLDKAQLIINRPNGSWQIRGMELSSNITAHAFIALTKAVEAFNLPSYEYAV